MPKLVLIAHNVRSIHNVGSLLRSADGFGIDAVYLTGYTPYPQHEDDERLPHIARRATKQLHKTALGAEENKNISHRDDVFSLLSELKNNDYQIAAIEQAKNSVPLPHFKPDKNTALLVGREVEGLEPEVLDEADIVLEIPMHGQKESFNVSIAGSIALYHCKNQP